MSKKIIDTQALKQIVDNEFAELINHVQEPFASKLKR